MDQDRRRGVGPPSLSQCLVFRVQTSASVPSVMQRRVYSSVGVCVCVCSRCSPSPAEAELCSMAIFEGVIPSSRRSMQSLRSQPTAQTSGLGPPRHMLGLPSALPTWRRLPSELCLSSLGGGLQFFELLGVGCTLRSGRLGHDLGRIGPLACVWEAIAQHRTSGAESMLRDTMSALSLVLIVRVFGDHISFRGWPFAVV